MSFRDSKIVRGLKKMLRPLYHRIKERQATKGLKKNFRVTRGEKIKAVFICQAQPVFNKMRPVIDALLQDDRFEVALFLVDDPKDKNPESNVFIEYARNNQVKVYEYEEGLLKKLHADYVVYPRPYDAYLPHDIQAKSAVAYARLCYIPYGYSTMEMGEVSLNPVFTRNIGLFFADMDYSHEYFTRNHARNLKSGLQKSFNLGYPYLEYICKNSEGCNGSSAFLNLPESGLKLLWTPRWTTDDKMGGSNFIRYIDKIFAQYMDNPAFSFVFRPHPYAFDNYVQLGLLTQEQKEEYLLRFEKSTNSVYDKADDYFDTLKDADVAIMDVSSIVAERVVTGKPIIFCHNEGGEILNDKMKEMLRYLYNAYSFEEIEKFVADIKSGNDPMKEEREKYCTTFKESMRGTCERCKEAFIADYNERCAENKGEKK